MGISSDVIRGYNDTIILYLILKEPSYGYEISKQIRTLSKEKYVIKETTLYSAFTRMEKNGYIESFSEVADSGKRRTYYRITNTGKEYYYEKCEEWQLTKEVIEQFILQSAENSDGYAVRATESGEDLIKPAPDSNKVMELADQIADLESKIAALEAQKTTMIRKGEEA